MKKKLIGLMLCLLMVAGLVPMIPEEVQAANGDSCAESGCSGTYENGFCSEDATHYQAAEKVTYTSEVPGEIRENYEGYYAITNAGQLAWFANKVNTENAIYGSENAVLTADIDYNPGYTFHSDRTVTKDGNTVQDGWREWTPIGTDSNKYAGTFAGNGKTVSGLYKAQRYNGLIGYLDGTGTVKDVGVINSYIAGAIEHGGIVGHNCGTVMNCYNTSVIPGGDWAGGIVGYNIGTVTNCYNLGTISSGNGPGARGGVVGSNANTGEVTNCYNIGNVEGSTSIGGVIGANKGTVTNCYYLSNCAKNTNDVVQFGIGNSSPDSFTADIEGVTTGLELASFHSGEVTYKLNGSKCCETGNEIITWYQNIGTEDYPQLSGKRVHYDESANTQYFNVENHTHVWTYSVENESKIRILCGADHCNDRDNGIVFISKASDMTYNGEPKGVVITWQDAEENLFPEIKYTDKNGITTTEEPVQAGAYTASATLGEATISIEFNIKKAPLTIINATAAIAEKDYNGKDTVALTDVALAGIKNADAVAIDVSKLTGKLAGANAGTYDSVTLEGLTADGVLKGADAANYTLEVPTGSVNLSTEVKVKPATPPVSDYTISKSYIYTVDSLEAIDLTEFLPEDCGAIAVSQPTVTGDITFTADGIVRKENTLTYTVCKGDIGDIGTISFKLNSENYQPVHVTIDLTLRDKYKVIALDDVTLKSHALVVGESLSKLEFNQVKFSADGKVIEGTLAWKDASIVPKLGTTSATWVFTPKNTDVYQTLTGTVAIAVTKAPHIQGEEGKQGWDVVRDRIAGSREGETVKVDMNGATVVPGDVFTNIKGKDITIVLDMGYGIAWTVNGKDVTAGNIADIDMAVTVGTDEYPLKLIPLAILNTVTGEKSHVEINLAHNGDFGFKAVLTINLEAKNAGLYANLYYYDAQKKAMEFICADQIAADGSAELTFTHASDYTVVIDKVAADADTPKNTSTPTSPNTGDANVIVLVMMLVIGVCGVVVNRRKVAK